MTKYLNRCYELAKLAGSNVLSNPQVGAVIVYGDRIIGEGFHKKFGAPHAEVMAIANVKDADKKYISESTLYVSLEPCCHIGKTSPCTDLILREKIKQVHIGTLDPFEKVSGKGVAILRAHSVNVIIHNDMRAEELIRPFKTFQLSRRPYITIKFAQSRDNYIGLNDKQIWLSNEFSKVLAHQLRASHDAILIGTNTAVIDDPSLTTREVRGTHPVRLVIDKYLKISKDITMFSDNLPTVVFNSIQDKIDGNKKWIKLESDDYVADIVNYAYKNHFPRLLIEGGAKLINSFILKDLWDEAYVIRTDKILENGIVAPNLSGHLEEKLPLVTDSVMHIIND